MDWKWFWLHKSNFEKYNMDVGFGIFTPPHIIWLVLCVCLIALLILLYKKGSKSRRENMQKALAIFLTLSEFFKICFYCIVGAPVTEFMPLFFCSFAMYLILIDAMWPTKSVKKALALGFLPAAALALLFPTTNCYSPLSFYSIHQFVFHALVIAYPLMNYYAGELSFKYIDVWKPFLYMLIPTFLIYWTNIYFNLNNMFLRNAEGNPLLELFWRISGGGIRYTLVLILFCVIVTHITYGIFAFAQTSGKRKGA